MLLYIEGMFKMLLKNETGSALIMVLLVIVVASITGVAILSIGVNEDVQTTAEQFNMQAYYIARGAAEGMAVHISSFYDKIDADDVVNEIDAVLSEEITFADGTATVTVTDEPGDEILIVANSVIASNFTGNVNILMEYTFDQELWFWTMEDLDPSKIHIDSTVPPAVLSSNGMVEEDVRSGDPIYNSDSGQEPNGPYTPSNIIEEASVEIPNNDAAIVDENTFVWGDYDNVLEIIDSVVGTYTVNTSSEVYDPLTGFDVSMDTYYIDDLTMRNGSVLRINCENDDVNIVVNTVEFKSDVVIVADESNDFRVRVYVLGDGNSSTDDINIQTPLLVNTAGGATVDDPEKLWFYLADGVTMNYAANGSQVAMIYGPGATVDFNSNVTFEGTITVKEFGGTGQPDITVHPPDGEPPEFSRYLIKQWID